MPTAAAQHELNPARFERPVIRLGSVSIGSVAAVAGPERKVRCSATHPNSKADGILCGALDRSRLLAAISVLCWPQVKMKNQECAL